MKPVNFKEVNRIFAEDQPQYSPLPAFEHEDQVVFKMRLSFIERVRVLFTGSIWCSLMMFGKPLTPSFFSTKKSDVLITNNNQINEKTT